MDNFTKKDIKNGAVVEVRNGQRFLKVDDILLNLDMSGGFMPLQKYDDNFDMIYENLNKYDIMKVLNPRENSIYKEACNLALCDIKEKVVKWTWERKEKRTIKLKDLTCEQYKKWQDKHCLKIKCENCMFYKVSCSNYSEANTGWINNKDLYSDKFLNQEIEIEE